MSYQDKLAVQNILDTQYHFDELIDENPEVLERVARGEARGEARERLWRVWRDGGPTRAQS